MRLDAAALGRGEWPRFCGGAAPGGRCRGGRPQRRWPWPQSCSPSERGLDEGNFGSRQDPANKFVVSISFQDSITWAAGLGHGLGCGPFCHLFPVLLTFIDLLLVSLAGLSMIEIRTPFACGTWFCVQMSCRGPARTDLP